MQTKNERLKEQVVRMSGVNPLKCMRCGKCSATCPAYDEMEYHPHQFVYMVERGKIEPLLNSKSLYQCLSHPNKQMSRNMMAGSSSDSDSDGQ